MAQNRHQDPCAGVSQLNLRPGATLSLGTILSNVSKHQLQDSADPWLVGGGFHVSLGIKEEAFISSIYPQLWTTKPAGKGDSKLDQAIKSPLLEPAIFSALLCSDHLNPGRPGMVTRVHSLG